MYEGEKVWAPQNISMTVADMAKETNITFCWMRSNNNSIQFLITYVLSEQLQGQSHKQQSADMVITLQTIRRIQTTRSVQVEKLLFQPCTTKKSIRTIRTRNTIPINNNVVLRKQGVTAKHDWEKLIRLQTRVYRGPYPPRQNTRSEQKENVWWENIKQWKISNSFQQGRARFKTTIILNKKMHQDDDDTQDSFSAIHITHLWFVFSTSQIIRCRVVVWPYILICKNVFVAYLNYSNICLVGLRTIGQKSVYVPRFESGSSRLRISCATS